MVSGAESQISYNDLTFNGQLSVWKSLRPTKRPTELLLLKTGAASAITSSGTNSFPLWNAAGDTWNGLPAVGRAALGRMSLQSSTPLSR